MNSQAVGDLKDNAGGGKRSKGLGLLQKKPHRNRGGGSPENKIGHDYHGGLRAHDRRQKALVEKALSLAPGPVGRTSRKG